MAARNDITGDQIRSRGQSKNYADNWDAIFCKKEELFYLQDTRSFSGNDIMWHQKGGGYTSDLSQAAVFSLEDAQAAYNNRKTDVPWPKTYIDRRIHPAVDTQVCKRKEAMIGSSITKSSKDSK